VLGVFVAIALGLALAAVLNDARRSLGWFFAAAVVAVLLDGPVDALARRMRRGLAILLMLIVIAVVAGVVMYGVFNDFSSELRKLERQVPEAAAALEESERFGDLARDLRLAERAEEAVDGLGERLAGEARATAASFGAYFAGTVLVLFLLAWLPRYIEGALAVIDDEGRRRRMRYLVDTTLRHGRSYLSRAIVVAVGSGTTAFAVARVADLPAPVALGLFVAIFSLIPYLGVMVAAVPMVLLAAGLESSGSAVAVLLAMFVTQVGAAFAMRRVQRSTLYVGPGVTLVVGLLGYAVYNIGGALFGIAGAVFALAFVDAVATDGDLGPDSLDALTIV
jgi:predicted PurR-regulated permease PerM